MIWIVRMALLWTLCGGGKGVPVSAQSLIITMILQISSVFRAIVCPSFVPSFFINKDRTANVKGFSDRVRKVWIVYIFITTIHITWYETKNGDGSLALDHSLHQQDFKQQSIEPINTQVTDIAYQQTLDRKLIRLDSCLVHLCLLLIANKNVTGDLALSYFRARNIFLAFGVFMDLS